MVNEGVKAPDRMEDFDCLELLSSLCWELEEEATAAAVSSSHKESDGGASPLSGKLVITYGRMCAHRNLAMQRISSENCTLESSH